MRRKILQDFANTLGQMFVGWRFGDDLAKFSKLPEGKLQIDVLRGKAVDSQGKTISLRINNDLQAWLQSMLARNQIRLEDIQQAMLDINFHKKTPTPEDALQIIEIECAVTITTNETTYVGARAKEVWPIKKE